MDSDIEIIDINQDNIETESFDEILDTDIENIVDNINMQEPEVLNDQMSESLLGSMTVYVDANHSSYLPNQHTIGAITGLTEILDNIQALKDTLYAKNFNTATYYLWNDENPLQENRKGYFVCISINNKISICSNNNVFGVTVDAAGFVGNQREIARDSKYELVVNDGLVNVRCETDVAAGDYVRPNAYGRAKKNDLYGYKVVAVSDIGGDRYATIALSYLFDGACDAADSIDDLEDRMDNAEINIAAAVNVSNSAYNIAESSLNAVRVANEANNKATTVVNYLDEIQDDISAAITNAEQAISIANATSAVAANIRNEAVSTANQALASAASAVGTANTLQITVDDHTATLSTLSNWQTDTNTSIAQLQQIVGPDGAQLQGLVANIDKYRVGDYSQANGLTFAQALDILDVGSAYIPTVDHTEVYSGSPNVTMRFSRGYYYTWKNTGWEESASTMVNFSHVYIIGNYNSPYWYVDSGSDITDNNNNTYTAHSLYKWENGEWKKVVTFNSLGRSVGLLQAKADGILAEVTNARGAEASLDLRISNDEAQASMIASMVTDNTNITISATVANVPSASTGSNGNYYAVGSSVPYDVYKKVNGAWTKISYLSYDGENVKEVNAASIVNSVNNSGSAININANKINFTGFTTFLRPSDVGSSGSTTIDGARISTGTINTARLNASGIITAINNNTTTTISGNKIRTGIIQSDNYAESSGICTDGTKIDLTNGAITSKNFKIDSSGNATFSGSGTFSGTVNATSGSFTGKIVTNNITATYGKFSSVNIDDSCTVAGEAINGKITVPSITINNNGSYSIQGGGSAGGYAALNMGNIQVNYLSGTYLIGTSSVSGNTVYLLESGGHSEVALTANGVILNNARTSWEKIINPTITAKFG